jgi:galactose-1-phosphate uridylyltransferase
VVDTEEEMPQNDNTVLENAVYEKVQCFTNKFESLHQAFVTCEVSIDKLLRRIRTSGKVSLQLLVE